MESINEVFQPMELSEFKNLGPHMPTTILDIPEKPENRHPTDKLFLVVFVVFLALLAPFLIYTLINSDIRRITHGFDDCGNICGEKNPKYDQWDCTGKDYTNKPYLKDNGDSYECVEECGDNYNLYFGMCVRSDLRSDTDDSSPGVGTYLTKGSVIFKLTICILIVIGISYGMLQLFRYAMGVVVWGTIILVFVLSILLVALMWAAYDSKTSDDYLLTCCIIGSIFLAAFTTLIFCARKRIPLVIQLLTEATNAVFAMPSLLLVPICTFLTFTVIVILWAITTAYMQSSGELTEIPGTNKLTYQLTSVMSLTVFYNSVITLWSLQFIGGLQYMIIGGAVAEWYFAKDKTFLYQPVRRSFNTAYRFHLGTVLFGSLIITLATIIRIIIKALIKNGLIRRCVDYCLSRMLELVNFLNQNAYIITAMHGQPFLKSGKRAAQLLAANLSDVLTLNIIIKFVMVVMVLLIAISSALLSILVFIGDSERNYVPNAIMTIFFLAIFSGAIFVSVLQTTVDAIFICYCEDKLLNDGMERPYAMSNELMEFVDNAKKVMGEKFSYGQFDQKMPQSV